MKKLIIMTALLLGFSQSASAFQIRAQINLSPIQITAQVFNYLNRAVICDIETFGYRKFGSPLRAWADNIIVQPGQTGYAYIYTTYYNTFFNGKAYANCVWY
jgi:hypothetical protein